MASNEYASCQSLVPALGVRVIPKAQVTRLRKKMTKAHKTVRSLPFLHLPVQKFSLKPLLKMPLGMSFNNYSGSGPVRRVCLQKNPSQAPTLALNRTQGRGGAAGDPSLSSFSSNAEFR